MSEDTNSEKDTTNEKRRSSQVMLALIAKFTSEYKNLQELYNNTKTELQSAINKNTLTTKALLQLNLQYLDALNTIKNLDERIVKIQNQQSQDFCALQSLVNKQRLELKQKDQEIFKLNQEIRQLNRLHEEEKERLVSMILQKQKEITRINTEMNQTKVISCNTKNRKL